MQNPYQKRLLAVLICVLALTLSGFAQKTSTTRKSTDGPAPNKAYLQKIWDTWSTLDPANAAEFYAKGPHVFFDIAPLKYNNWDEYQKGATKILSDYKTAKFSVNDDAEIYPTGTQYAWGTATVKEDATMKSGNKREMATLRWTVIFHHEDGKWLIVHEHVSEPAH